MSDPSPEQREALARLGLAVTARVNAVEEYADAIFEAAASGLPNTTIAREVGVTETAIRLYRKRHGL